MDESEYFLGDVDWQLLFELQIALLHRKPLPLTTLRPMRERGWIALPPKAQWIVVRAVMLGGVTPKRAEAYSYTLATPVILPGGARELQLFSRTYPDDVLNDMYESEMDDAEHDDDW